jgi:hypothetical protein
MQNYEYNRKQEIDAILFAEGADSCDEREGEGKNSENQRRFLFGICQMPVSQYIFCQREETSEERHADINQNNIEDKHSN